MGLNRTSLSNVKAVWICPGLPCSITRVSICYGAQSEIQVKSYGLFNLLGASLFHFECHKLRPFKFLMGFLFQFLASQYIMGLNRTFKSNVKAVWICPGLPCSITRVSICYGAQRTTNSNVMAIWIFLRLPFQFWPSRYIMGLNQTSESKVKAVWICLKLSCLISSVWIYYGSK